MRIAPNALSLNSPAALKEIYGFKSNVRKSDFYDAFVHPAPNTHNSRDRDVHARKRRVMAQGFGDAAVRGMEGWILGNVRVFCERVGEGAGEEGWSGVRNMSDWFSYLAMDVLGDLCYGKAFHMLEKEENRYALGLVAAATKRHLVVSLPEHFPGWMNSLAELKGKVRHHAPD